MAGEEASGEQGVYDCLERLRIPWTRHVHPPVFTVEEAERYWTDIPATHCKNLFLRDSKGTRHYLVVMQHTKKADLRALGGRLGGDRLSFASPERLMRILGLTPGSVSPFGLIHESAREVIVVLDADLAASDRVAFHPNVNMATVTLATADFRRFLAACGNVVRQVTI